jgi:hypothetical protein
MEDCGCVDNVFIGAIDLNLDPPGFREIDYPLDDDVYLSFRERGETVGQDGCEGVFVVVDFDHRARLTYVLQRGPSWDSSSDGSACHDIFLRHTLLLDPQGGTYVRNLVADAITVGLGRPSRVTLISLEAESGASGTFDDVQFFVGR